MRFRRERDYLFSHRYWSDRAVSIRLSFQEPRGDSGFVDGLSGSVPVVIGYLPIALAFGLLARACGLSLGTSMAFSALVFAGASQFIALNLLQVGVSPASIALTTLLVNMRHLLMSTALSTRLARTRLSPLIAFGVTDETFAVASTRTELSPSFLLGLELPSYVSWVAGTGIGHALAKAVPPAVQDAFGVALYAMFIALLVPSAMKSYRVAIVALAAGGVNTVLESTGLWTSGINMVVAMLAGALLGTLMQALDATAEEATRVS